MTLVVDAAAVLVLLLDPGASGERIGVDGTVMAGSGELDTSLITGETVPQRLTVGDRVFAGTINLGAPLRLRVRSVGELMENQYRIGLLRMERAIKERM